MAAAAMTEAEKADAAKRAAEAPTSSWVAYDPATCHFPIQNLPFGVFSTANSDPRCGVAIGDFVLDMSILHSCGLLQQLGAWTSCFCEPKLNGFMSQTPARWSATRSLIGRLLSSGCATLRDNEAVKSSALIPMSSVTMHLPCQIGDYTDFYASREHATNVGTMFRGKDNALQPNWLHLPVGYHGRSSSVVVSGTPIRRPWGQLQKDRTDPKQGPVFGTCKLMDFEIEMGCFVGGKGNELGTPIKIEEADNNVFGFVILNDWSARDIQKWEYIPLGPFTGKNVMTSISPWVVMLEALQPFRCPTSAGKQTDPVPLPYLRDPYYDSFNLELTAAIMCDGLEQPHVISRTNFRNMYWNHRQQLVHHTVTGCNMRAGDLLGSGTISGQTPDNYGSMLEICWKGTKPMTLLNGEERKFLKDGDELIMEGVCRGDGYLVGFGQVSGKVLPAHPAPGM